MEADMEEKRIQELTIDDVRAHLKSGAYIARKPKDRTSKCFSVILVLYERNGAEVPNWYACSHCDKLIKINVSSGTGKLLRHAAEHDENLNVKCVQKIKKPQIIVKHEALKADDEAAMTSGNDIATTSNAAHDTCENSDYIISADDLIVAFEISTRIGNNTGPVDKNEFKKYLPDPKKKWENSWLDSVVKSSLERGATKKLQVSLRRIGDGEVASDDQPQEKKPKIDDVEIDSSSKSVEVTKTVTPQKNKTPKTKKTKPAKGVVDTADGTEDVKDKPRLRLRSRK